MPTWTFQVGVVMAAYSPTPRYRLCRPPKVVKINLESEIIALNAFFFVISLCQSKAETYELTFAKKY